MAGSLFSDELDDHMNEPQLLELLDRPLTTSEAEAAPSTETLQSDAPPLVAHSQLSLPSSASPLAASASSATAAATSLDDLVPASYATLPFPLPFHVPMPRTAWSLLASPSPVLSLGCRHLDELLDGGLRPGVTELVGEAGAAKSQICFQLLLQVQLGLCPPPPAPHSSLSDYGLDGCGLYIVSEGRPPMTRLQQLQEAMHHRFSYTVEYDFLANVFLQEAHSVDQLLSIVEQLCVDEKKVSEQRLRLLIIDSVAALFRVDDDVGMANSVTRADAQFRLSSALRRLSSQQRMVVVVCNQVTDRFLPAEPILRSSETYRDRYSILSSGRQVLPALGLSWANCVDVRLALSRRSGGRGAGGAAVGGVSDGSEVLREMEVIFAPHLPRRSMSLVVDADGVRGKEKTMKLTDGADSGDEWIFADSTVKLEQQQQQPAVLTERIPLKPIPVNVRVPPRAMLTTMYNKV